METATLIYAGLGLLAFVFLSLYIALVLCTPPPIITYPSERKYRSNKSPSKCLPLTTLSEPATCDLTIVVPAFNETARLPVMMESTMAYLTSSVAPKISTSTSNGKANGHGGNRGAKSQSRLAPDKRTYEIVIVDDGSSDSTSQTALALAKKYDKMDIKVVTLEKNVGKGGAVRHGMMHASGRRLLMADADGASRIEDLEGLWRAMDGIHIDTRAGEKEEEGPKVVVGSRAHLVKTAAVVKRSFIRNILMYGLHTILRIVGVGHIRDTQCGFKLFSRAAARSIFPSQHLATWIFDVELLLLAKQMGIPVAEVPIEWHEVEGSKLNVFTASLQMLRDLLVVRGNHLTGRWKAGLVKVKNE